MHHTNVQGDLMIEPSLDGLKFSVNPGSEITFTETLVKKSSWRWLVSAVISVFVLSLPNFSLAATYTAADIVQATNVARTEHGVTTLTVNSKLTQAAQAKANDMFAQNYFGHYSPTGTAPWVFFKNAGYSFTSAGENLAADYVDGHDIVPAWLSSKTHRENLLSTLYHDIGIAVVDGTINGSPTTVVVQFFGSRQSAFVAAPTPTITKKAVTVSAPTVVTKTTPAPAPKAAPAPAVVPAPVVTIPPELPVTLVPPTPVALAAEVKGVTTEVIPSSNLSPNYPAPIDPQIIVTLILATLGLYTTLLTAVGLTKGLVTHPIQALAMEFGQATI